MKGIMSFEALFSLSVLLIFISSLSLVNTRQLDYSIYEYQLLNDILEVTEKTGGMEKISRGDTTPIEEMQNLARSQGYCLDIILTRNDETLENINQIIDLIVLQTNYPSNCQENKNKISTKRTVPTYLGGIIELEAVMWKQ